MPKLNSDLVLRGGASADSIAARNSKLVLELVADGLTPIEERILQSESEKILCQ